MTPEAQGQKVLDQGLSTVSVGLEVVNPWLPVASTDGAAVAIASEDGRAPGSQCLLLGGLEPLTFR